MGRLNTMCMCVCCFSVISHDIQKCWVVITDCCSAVQLPVDTSLIEPFEARMNSLHQFIGEVESSDQNSGVSERCLKAISHRCVDGLDVPKYYDALDARRAYLQQRNNCASK